jgi:hypothetical protein
MAKAYTASCSITRPTKYGRFSSLSRRRFLTRMRRLPQRGGILRHVKPVTSQGEQAFRDLSPSISRPAIATRGCCRSRALDAGAGFGSITGRGAENRLACRWLG